MRARLYPRLAPARTACTSPSRGRGVTRPAPDSQHARDEEGRRELEARVARIRTKRTDLLLNVLKVGAASGAQGAYRGWGESDLTRTADQYCANAGVAANQSGYLKMTTGMQLHDGAVGALGAVAALCSLQKVARTVAKEHRAKQA